MIEGEENNQFQCDKYVLVETDGKEKLYTFIGKRNVADAELSKYVFAYANDLPLMISTDTGEIIIHTRYLVKSKFYSNMIMPLDRTVQLWISENEDRNHILKKDAECVLSIILCILSGEHIKRELREQAKKNKEIWKCQKVKEVMNKVFFSYGSYAMRYIYNERFNEVINEYIAFAEY